MNEIFIHPLCIFCDNCSMIKPKEGYQIIQDEDNKQYNFCAECMADLDEYIEETEI